MPTLLYTALLASASPSDQKAGVNQLKSLIKGCEPGDEPGDEPSDENHAPNAAPPTAEASEALLTTLRELSQPHTPPLEESHFKLLKSIFLDNVKLMTESHLEAATELLIAATKPPNTDAERRGSLVQDLLPTVVSFLPPTLHAAAVMSLTASPLASSFAITVAATFREISASSPLSTSAYDDAVELLLPTLAAVSDEDRPSLVYQLVLMCARSGKQRHIIDVLAETCQTFDGRKVEEGGKGEMLATTLSHLCMALRQNKDIGKAILKMCSGAVAATGRHVPPLKFMNLSPFRVALLMSLASAASAQRDEALLIVKDAVVEEVLHVAELAKAPWLSAIAPNPASSLSALHTTTSILKFVDYARITSSDSLIEALIEAGFILVDVVKKDKNTSPIPTPPHYAVVANCGREILAALYETSPVAASSIIKGVESRATGCAPNACEHAKLLTTLLSSSACDSLIDFTPTIVGWLGHLATGGLPAAAVPNTLIPVLSSLLPRARASIDQVFLFAKKALFCADVERRCAGAQLLVLLATVSGVDDEILGYLQRVMKQQTEAKYAAYSTILSLTEQSDDAASPASPALTALVLAQLRRYVVEAESDETRQQRQSRAVGLSQGGQSMSQMADEADADPEVVETSPLILAPALQGAVMTAVASSSSSKDKKENPFPALTQAGQIISEPMTLLLSVAARLSRSNPEMKAYLDSLRSRVAKSELETLMDDTCPPETRIANALLVAKIVDGLFLSFEMDAEDEEEKVQCEKLFELRASALEKASAEVYREASLVVKKTKAAFSKSATDNSKRQSALKDRAGKAVSDYLSTGYASVIEHTPSSAVSGISEFINFALKLEIEDIEVRRYLVDASLLVLASQRLSGKDKIATGMCIGPLMFREFACHAKRKSRTSLGDDPEPVGLSSITCFLAACRRVVENVEHDMTAQQRLAIFMKMALNTACSDANRVGDYLARNAGESLEELLTVFTSSVFKADGAGLSTPGMTQTSYEGGIIAELIAVDMQAEAIMCCEIVACAAKLLPEAKRTKAAATLLTLWDDTDRAFRGPLTLAQGEFVSIAHNAAMNVVVKACQVSVDLASDVGATLHVGSLLQAACGLTDEFLVEGRETEYAIEVDDDSEIEALTSLVQYAHDKVADVATALVHKADVAMVQIEYAHRKIQSGDEERADTVNDAVCGILHNVSQLVSVIAPIASGLDNSLKLAGSILKLTKKLYFTGSRTLQTFANNPSLTTSPAVRSFLDEMTVRTTFAANTLLLILQSQVTVESSGKKKTQYVSESSIRSHGKIASDLVYEKEKFDLALGRVVTKCKIAKLETKQSFFAQNIVVLKNRDFKIKEGEVADAQKKEGEATAKKVKPEKKRKSEGGTPKKKKKKKQVEESDDDAGMMSDE